MKELPEFWYKNRELNGIPSISIDDLDTEVASYSEKHAQAKVNWINEYLKCIYQLSKYQFPTGWPYTVDKDGRKVLERAKMMSYIKKSCNNRDFLQIWYLIAASSFSVLSQQFIDAFANFLQGKRVLELFSGTGALAYGLKAKGVDIYATTFLHPDPSDKYYNEETNRPWPVFIEDTDALDAINNYVKGMDYVLVSWPPREHTRDYECYLRMKELNPSCKMIFMGDTYWSGSSVFHSKCKLEPIESLQNEIISVDSMNNIYYIPEKYAVHDGIYFVSEK